MAEKRFMEAVAEKIGKRQPVLKRKPGMAVMIAIGGPKGPPMERTPVKSAQDEEDAPEMTTSKAERIAKLQAKIASLKAELALLEDEDEMEEVEEEAYEEDAEKDEDEDDGEEGD
jgi:hypothetical protein